MPSLDLSGWEDGAARVCAWADHLENAGRISDAREFLQTELGQHGDGTGIAVRLAVLERDNGHLDQAIETLAKVRGAHSGDLLAGRILAEILLTEGRSEEAAAIIDARPESGAGDFGELAGSIFRAAGQHSRAVDAFSRCGSLSRSGRWQRRRSWWRCGGPFRRVAPSDPPAAPVQEPGEAVETTDALLELVAWAQCLNDQDRRDESRHVLTDALAHHGRHPRLLRCLAELEDSDGAGQTALYLWCEAYRACPTDVDTVCGLARQLAKTTVTPSYTSRVQEARRILDAFAEPSHPEIKSARAAVLEAGGATSARIAAAGGPAEGLPARCGQARKYHRRRSAGPLGQFCVRLVDSVRGPQRLPAAALMPGCAESEEVARFLDSLREQPDPVARQRIREAWQRYGHLPSLLLACADANAYEGQGWACLALGAEAAQLDPGNLTAVCRLAYAFDTAEDYPMAVQILEGLPTAARQTTEVRVTLGNIHRYAGNYALAAAAYGDPRDLDGFDRWSRRRSLCFGLLQRRRTGTHEDEPLMDFVTLSPDVAEILDRVAIRLDEPGSCHAELEAAIAEHGRHPLLLLYLARASRYVGDDGACAALAREALAGVPGSALITAIGLRELYLAHRGDEALKVFTDAPDEVRDDSYVRVVAGQIYHGLGMAAHAVDAFGQRVLAPAWHRRERRGCWWRSGGLLHGLRSSLRAMESRAQSSWPLPEVQVTALEALALPTEASSAVRGALVHYRMGLVGRTTLSPAVVQRWLGSVLAPVIAVAVITTLIAGVLVRWPGYSFWSQAAPVVAVTAALGVVWWTALRWTWPAAVRLVLAVGSAAAAGFLLGTGGPWPFGAGVGLATLALGLIINEAAEAVPRLRLARWRRRQAETAVLSDLLELLGAVAAPSSRRDLSTRRWWLSELEATAITLERYALRGLGGRAPKPGDAIAARFRGLAASLRALKPSIAVAGDSSWHQVVTQLRGHAAALARGDLESWPVPARDATAAQLPQPWWSRTMLITRTVLVIFGPPLAVFLLPLVVSISGSGYAWLQIVTVVWALLGCIVALDPRLTARITQMRAVLSLLRDSTPPAGPAEPTDPATAAGRPGPPRRGSTIRTPARYNRKSRPR